MLKTGNGLEAYGHFESSYELPGLDHIDISPGMMFAVKKLLDNKDLISAASTLARHSRTSTYSAEIGGWHNGSYGEDFYTFDDESRYLPDLVGKFYQEAGIVAAEEWIHVLQHTSGKPVAGVVHSEADVAAYLVGSGIELSDDFITRYPERTDWYLSDHPERREQLQQFCREFGRRTLL